MRRRSRTCGVAKWVGLSMCAALSLAFVPGLGKWTYGLRKGDRILECDGETVDSFVDLRSAFSPRKLMAKFKVRDVTGRERFVYASSHGRLAAFALSPNGWLASALALAGAFSAFLFWRDRCFPEGHCQMCGYDLTGNVSGRCPECGTAVGDEKATDTSG
jgi:hypothetical protein